jgi:hypothetical protein
MDMTVTHSYQQLYLKRKSRQRPDLSNFHPQPVAIVFQHSCKNANESNIKGLHNDSTEDLSYELTDDLYVFVFLMTSEIKER